MAVPLLGRYIWWMKREVSALCLDMEPGVILGGNLDSSDNSGEKNFIGRRLAKYFGIKSAGSTDMLRWD